MVRDPDSLVELFELRPNSPPRSIFAFSVFKDIFTQSSTLRAFIAQANNAASFQSRNGIERVNVQGVTDNYFGDLGVPIVRGRRPTPGELGWAVLSRDCWHQRFNDDVSVIGTDVLVDRRSLRVIGITGAGFNGTNVDWGPDVRVNLQDMTAQGVTIGAPQFVEIIGRLKTEYSLMQAQQEISSLTRHSIEETISGEAGAGLRRSLLQSQFELRPIGLGVSKLRPQFRPALVGMLWGSVLLLLIVTSNVSSILLIRSLATQRLSAIRQALGASHGRIVREQLIEVAVPTCAGSLLALVFVFVAAPMLAAFLPSNQFDYGAVHPISLFLHLDSRGLLVCLTACAVAATGAALGPAWRSASANINLLIRRRATDIRYRRSQLGLSGLQVAISIVLTVSAGWSLRSVANLREDPTGLDIAHIATFSIDTELNHYEPANTRSLQMRLLSEVRAIPGVAEAGISANPVLQGTGISISVVGPGRHSDDRAGPNSSVNLIGNGYFAAMGMRILQGRTTWQLNDLTGPTTPVVVNEAFAKHFLHSDRLLGWQFATGWEFVRPVYTVIGEVADSKYRSIIETTPPTFYIPRFETLHPPSGFVLNVRTHENAKATINSVRNILRSIDPALPISHMATLEEDLEASLSPQTFVLKLALGFALIGILLSIVGLYGVLAQFVASAKRDIGIRVALGAGLTDVVLAILRPILFAVLGGGLVGAIASVFVGRFMGDVVPNVRLADPVVIGATALVLAVTTISSAVPALRGLDINPAVSIREE
jgi:predicted permease